MPTYSFQCQRCGRNFDLRASINEREAGLFPECPYCDSSDARQLIMAASVLRGGKDATSSPCCGPTSGTRCCR